MTDRRKCALDGFAVAQHALRRFEGQQVQGDERRELWRSQWEIAWQTAGQFSWPESKELQLKAAAGAPLTVCFGHMWRETAIVPGLEDRTGPGTFYPHGDGCGLVYPDATSTRGRHPFRIYCPACSQAAARLARRPQSRALAFAAGREEVVVGYRTDGSEELSWSGECSCCGVTFWNSRPDTSRCATCRASHRSSAVKR